jgi:hypothetical protein
LEFETKFLENLKGEEEETDIPRYLHLDFLSITSGFLGATSQRRVASHNPQE